MLTLIAAAVLAASAPQSSPELDRTLEPCRQASLEAYRRNDMAILDRYVSRLARDPRRNREAIVVCAAYLRGVMDASAGRYPRGQ